MYNKKNHYRLHFFNCNVWMLHFPFN
jgi:hypothetical protein